MKPIIIDVKEGRPVKTLERANIERIMEDNNLRLKLHKKMYDTSESWPGKRILKTSLGDLIKSKTK